MHVEARSKHGICYRGIMEAKSTPACPYIIPQGIIAVVGHARPIAVLKSPSLS